MRKRSLLFAVAIALSLLGCEVLPIDEADPNDPAGDGSSQAGTLTLYPLSEPYGTPDHIVFGTSIKLDYSAFLPLGTNVEWEIMYTPEFHAVPEHVPSMWTWHEEFVTNEVLDFFPDGSGYYLIKLVAVDANRVVADGLLTVTNAGPNAVPFAAVTDDHLPTTGGSPLELETGETLQLGAGDSYDADGEVLQYHWSLYDVTFTPLRPFASMQRDDIRYTELAENAEVLNHVFNESGLYYLQLKVIDEAYDIGRDDIDDSRLYGEIYVRPAGEPAGPVYGAIAFDGTVGGPHDMVINPGDLAKYEIIAESARFPDMLIHIAIGLWNAEDGDFSTIERYHATNLTGDGLPGTEGSTGIDFDRDALVNADPIVIEGFTDAEKADIGPVSVRYSYGDYDTDDWYPYQVREYFFLDEDD